MMYGMLEMMLSMPLTEGRKHLLHQETCAQEKDSSVEAANLLAQNQLTGPVTICGDKNCRSYIS